MYLLCGKIAPAYEGVEMGIGDKVLLDAITSGLGCSPAQLGQKGGDAAGCDLGTAAQKCKNSQKVLSFGAKPKPLACKGQSNIDYIATSDALC